MHLGSKQLFENLNLVIEKGDKIGILGLNGSGKSTLFKILNGELSPDNSSDAQFYHANTQLLGQKPFLIPQELILPKDNLNKAYNALSYFHYIYPKENDFLPIYESYLKSFEFDSRNLEQDIKKLSGGEQKKILLAIGLCNSYECILWDEPTNHLDYDTIMEFEKILVNAKKTFLIITHDRLLLSKVATKLFILHNKKLSIFQGQYPEYLIHLEEQSTQLQQKISKLKNHLRREDEWMKQGIKARGTRSKKRVENFQELNNSISQLQNNLRDKWKLQIHSTQKKSKKLLELEDVTIGFDKNFPLIKIQEKIDCLQGDKIGIIGKSGVGKSTFLETILGNLPPLEGSIYQLPGVQVQLFTQKRDTMPLESTPFIYVGDGMESILRPDGKQQHIISYLEEFGFNKDEIHRSIKSFSGGEKNRLQLAKYLTNSADLYIFDEPTNDLDLESIELLEKTLMNFSKAVMIVSHDRTFIENICTKFFVIEDKKLIDLHISSDDLYSYLELSLIQKQNTASSELPLSSGAPNLPKIKQEKLTYSQKQQLKNIDSTIKNLESSIEELQEKINTFDHQSSKSPDSYSSLCQNLETKETELMELYSLKMENE